VTRNARRSSLASATATTQKSQRQTVRREKQNAVFYAVVYAISWRTTIICQDRLAANTDEKGRLKQNGVL
jgi:hypothetical protein